MARKFFTNKNNNILLLYRVIRVYIKNIHIIFLASLFKVLPDRVVSLFFLILKYIFASKINLINKSIYDLNDNRVIFFCTQIMGREKRMANSLKLNGFSPVLIKLHNSTLGQNSFDHVLNCNSWFEMFVVSNTIKTKISHFFFNTGDEAFFFVLRNKNKTVLDIYDPYSSVQIPRYRGVMEREVVKSVDAITCRDLRLQYLKKTFSYRIPNLSIYLLDPIPKRMPRERNQCDNIRVVSLGWIDGKNRFSSIYNTAKVLVENKIHVHVYLSPFNGINNHHMACYKDLLDSSDFFHIEKNIYGEDLIHEIKKYDFGLMSCEWDAFPNLSPPYEYDESWINGTGAARIMDYISAGLGIIVNKRRTKHLYFLAKRYSNDVVDWNTMLSKNPVKILSNALFLSKHNRLKSTVFIEYKYSGERLLKMYDKIERL